MSPKELTKYDEEQLIAALERFGKSVDTSISALADAIHLHLWGLQDNPPAPGKGSESAVYNKAQTVCTQIHRRIIALQGWLMFDMEVRESQLDEDGLGLLRQLQCLLAVVDGPVNSTFKGDES